MGILIMMNYKNPDYIIDRRKSNYTNKNAVENVIRYVTRTRVEETRAGELISYGGAGVGYYLPIEEIIWQFLLVQNIYNINARKGKRIYHEVFRLSEEDFRQLNCSYERVNEFAMQICQWYYRMGHQVVYAIHFDANLGIHIHLVVNTINFRNGLKWHTSMVDLGNRQFVYNRILYDLPYIVINKISG